MMAVTPKEVKNNLIKWADELEKKIDNLMLSSKGDGYIFFELDEKHELPHLVVTTIKSNYENAGWDVSYKYSTDSEYNMTSHKFVFKPKGN
jgi:hypothetical protein